ncbi:large conductance mechanosensitive channel protein MscL [Paenibacillus sp. IB182496]|uniref:Large-conductance mechanosensitive channel n=1 Tax=Paenibacillus sabuli TaxID=2772509 RepID=A0A927GUI6_9BACL|nr:large conductance mechanosensitive channel protein MscL [Paenibacillus sabuli]MBD2848205.1 large conductance mechanosensitive channel protein MscL [Paenibacillus sabuli]
MSGFLKELREFAVKGNVIDLAVGVIIGGAFGRIVTSLVNDIVMPPIGKLLGDVNFADLFINLEPYKTTAEGNPIVSLEQANAAGVAVIAYGNFINVVLNFIIVAVSIFSVIKLMNRLRRKEEQKEEAPAEPTEKECPYCLSKVPIKATRCSHCTSHLTETTIR